jgi:hypothetical protein
VFLTARPGSLRGPGILLGPHNSEKEAIMFILNRIVDAPPALKKFLEARSKHASALEELKLLAGQAAEALEELKLLAGQAADEAHKLARNADIGVSDEPEARAKTEPRVGAVVEFKPTRIERERKRD